MNGRRYFNIFVSLGQSPQDMYTKHCSCKNTSTTARVEKFTMFVLPALANKCVYIIPCKKEFVELKCKI